MERRNDSMNGRIISFGGINGGRDAMVAAPFVVKTYRMVNDPATDSAITWGRDNNSFVVVDPFVFSQTLLPAHFKHNNFSSFVRQLNTYGFRKVDPGRWEFAHTSFLRGQTHLLRQIVRQNGSGGGSGGGKKAVEDAEEGDMDEAMAAMVATEVVQLKQEQHSIDDKVQLMWSRIKEMECRPKRMLAFLVKVVGDAKLLQHLVGPVGEEGLVGMAQGSSEKRPKLCFDAASDGTDSWPLDLDQTMINGDDTEMYYSTENELVEPFIPAIDPARFWDGDTSGDILGEAQQVDWGAYAYPFSGDDGF